MRESAIDNPRDPIEPYIAALEEDDLPVLPEHFDTPVFAV